MTAPPEGPDDRDDRDPWGPKPSGCLAWMVLIAWAAVGLAAAVITYCIAAAPDG